MSRKDLLKILWELGQEVIDKREFELVDVEFVKESGNCNFDITSTNYGVTLDDCQTVSREVSRQLDIMNPIPHSYTLEVSSPY